MEYTTVSVRIPETYAASFEDASETIGVFRSELLRRALRYYVGRNPDGIGAFYQFEQQACENGAINPNNSDLTTFDEG